MLMLMETLFRIHCKGVPHLLTNLPHQHISVFFYVSWFVLVAVELLVLPLKEIATCN